MPNWPLPLNLRRIAILAGVVVLAYLVMDFNARLGNLVRLQGQVATVRVDATRVIETKRALETAIAYATSDDAVEEWARREAHWIMEGDQPVVPLSQGGPPSIVPTPAPPAPTPLPNWRIWWELFFGS